MRIKSVITFSLLILGIFYFGIFHIASEAYGAGAQEQYDYATELFKHRQYSNARREFKRLLDMFNQAEDSLQSELAPQALFYIGDSSFRLLDYEAGVKAYIELSDKYPDTELARRALLRVAKHHEDNGSYKEALDGYGLLIDRYQSYEQGVLAAEALPRLAGLFFDRSIKLLRNGKSDEGINGLQWMADRFPKTDFARRALLELGRYRESTGDYEGALKDYRRLAELYPGTEEAKMAAQRATIAQREVGKPEAKAVTPPTQTQSQPKEGPIPEKPVAMTPESAEGLLGGRRTFLALGSKLLGLETGMSLKVISPTADLREGAGTEYRVIAKVGKGDTLTLLDKSGRWYKVRTASAGEGWIWSGSVSESKFRVVLSLVNVRRAAGTSHDVITRVKKDTLLTKLDEVEGWYKVRLPDGSEGWIWGETLVLSETN